VSDYGGRLLEQQFSAGLGYEGRIAAVRDGMRGLSISNKPAGRDFKEGCDYSGNGWYKANGGGVKGGFHLARFTDRFFSRSIWCLVLCAAKDSRRRSGAGQLERLGGLK